MNNYSLGGPSILVWNVQLDIEMSILSFKNQKVIIIINEFLLSPYNSDWWWKRMSLRLVHVVIANNSAYLPHKNNLS